MTPEAVHEDMRYVRVHEYPDGTLAVFHGPRCLGRYDQEGNLETDKSSLRAA